jgi:hypothetical protein
MMAEVPFKSLQLLKDQSLGVSDLMELCVKEKCDDQRKERDRLNY